MKRAEKRTEANIRADIDKCFQRWNALAQGDCQDPFWEDGTNMNLVRNHIIYYYMELKNMGMIQTNLFGDVVWERPIPPEVPDNYMVMDGPYSSRLNGKRGNFTLGRKGQYYA